MIRWLGLIPFVAMILAAPFVNTIEPRIFHMPFFMAWLVVWIPLSSGVLWIIYHFDNASKSERS